MGAELGATTSVFPFDQKMVAYLNLTDRADIAKLAEANRAMLVADPEVLQSPELISTRSSKSICRNWSRTWLACRTSPGPFPRWPPKRRKGLSGRVEGCVDQELHKLVL